MATIENRPASVEGDGSVDKNKKYDRQLRLWGDHGQAALESAKVCLVNATATGTEILKNLILPGVGSFMIVDSNKVTGEDVGNNFFFDQESMGKSRAQVATEYLLELNSDVQGDYIEESADDILNNNNFFTNFTLVIATSLPEKTLLKLAERLYQNHIPLLVCRSYGLIGYLRIALPEHTVIESHPDSSHEDLRLDCPFQALIQYCDSLDLSKMTNKEHSHTPWLVLIYKFLQIWKNEHNGEPPKNYREKNEFKELLRQGIRKNEEGVPELEENFDEAVTNVNTALVPTKVPSEVSALFEDKSCNNLTPESSAFWILVRGLKDFVNNEGQGHLPVRGTIPDMTSDSERYIQLQNVYREQASQDIAAVSSYIHSHSESVGRGEPLPMDNQQCAQARKNPDPISENEIRTFCKNASFLRVVRCRSLTEEYDASQAKLSDLAYHLEDSDEDDLVWYVLLRAADRFYSEWNQYPGALDDQMETDIPKLKAHMVKLLQDWGIGPVIKDDFIHEMCRYGAAELHSVAAFMGGTAAQEAIKIITSQFVPINNTYIYNAMKQTSLTLAL